MSYDRSWRIRKQFANFMNEFLEPYFEYRDRHEAKTKSNDVTLTELKKKFPVSAQAKQTKKAFKTLLSDITLEVLNDADD